MEEQDLVMGKMSSIVRFIYETMPNFVVAGYVLYFVIFLLSVLVYKLGFAKKLKFKQNVVIYIFLLLGCLMLTFLAFYLRVVEALLVSALILIIYKIRMKLEKRGTTT